MGKPTSYAPGSFAWADLRTTDPADAGRFYAELFGWTYTDAGDAYTVALREGDAVAGLKRLAEGQRAGGDSPFWLTYVAVVNAAAAAARTRELGGTVRAEPFDVGAERMSVIADPTGAKLCLRQSPQGIGACRVDEPGCLTWYELTTDDAPTAARFYSKLFGWQIEPHEKAGPAHWLPYFEVTSLDETLARASHAGGRQLSGPREVRDGRSAILVDPQQAEFGILENRS